MFESLGTVKSMMYLRMLLDKLVNTPPVNTLEAEARDIVITWIAELEKEK